MPKKSSGKSKNFAEQWNRVISRAEDMLARSKGDKAERLQTHIAMMKESRDAGEPWDNEV